MIVILFRILISIAIIIIIYTAYQYSSNPQRLLQRAKNRNQFLFVDEKGNSKKNIQFVYKGCSFEGEKYLGITENSFDVVNIHVTVQEPLELKGFSKEDFTFLESEILNHYPNATVEWKHPINQLFK